MKHEDMEYVGFWPRAGAALIDTLLLMVVSWPLLTYVYGWEYWVSSSWAMGLVDVLITWVFPAVAAISFWRIKQATPGKMAVSARVVDARTGQTASNAKLFLRYIGYYVSLLPLGLGIIWVAFDRKKQGWHDKIAGTVVVRRKNHGPDPVEFERR